MVALNRKIIYKFRFIAGKSAINAGFNGNIVYLYK
jgi:hypothetical protein